MPVPVRLIFEGDAASATRAGAQTQESIQRVRTQAREANAELVEQARVYIREQAGVVRALQEQAVAAIDAKREQLQATKVQITAANELIAATKRGTDEYVAAMSVQKTLVERQIALETELGLVRRRSAASALLGGGGGGGGAAGAAGGLAAAERRAEARGLRGALGEGTRTLGFGRILGGPALVGGFIAGAGIAESIKLTLQAQQAQKQLQNALQDSGQSWAANREQIEATLKTQERISGFSREELTGAYTQLVRRLGDAGKAQKALAEATDLSRGTGYNLERSITVVTRAYQGNVGQLARIGIQVPKVTEHMDALRKAHIRVTDANRAQVIELSRQAQALDRQATATAAVEQIDKKYHDAALTRSRTLAGAIDALKNRFRDWATEVGEHAIPYAQRFFVWLNNLFDAIGRQHRALAVIRETLASFAAGISTIVQGLKLFWDSLSSGQRTLVVVGGAIVALTAIAEANPFIALATGTIVVVGIIRRHWTAIKGFFVDLWEAIKARALEFFDWIKIKGIQAALDFVEPFSHLPGRFGHWARKAKDALNGELDTLKADMARQGAIAGGAFGQSYLEQVKSYADQANAYLAPGSQVAGPAVPGSHPGAGQAGGAPVGTGTRTTAATRSIISTARSARGVPYQYGGAPSLSSPTDCSGLMVAVFQKNGISLPRTSQDQYGSAPIKDAKPLLPGDLVFSEGTIHPGHVGLYIGDGLVLEDPHTGDRVKTVPLAQFGWNGRSARWWGGKSGVGGGGGAGTGAAGDTSFNAALAAAEAGQPGAKPKKGPRTVSGTTIDALNESVSQTIHRFSVALSKDDLAATPEELDQIRHLNRLLAALHDGMKPAELARIRQEIKATTDAIGNEINAQTTAYAKARRAREAFAKTLVPIKQLVSGIISAATPGRADPTQEIGQAVGDLGNLGQTPDAAAARILARLQRLRTQLATLTRPGQASLRDRIRAEIQQWGGALNDELQKQLTKAQQISEQRQRNLDRGWRDLQTSAQRTFDATTQAWETRFDRDTQTTLDRMQAELQQRIASMRVLVHSAQGDFMIGQGEQTPAEKALAALQQSGTDTSLARTLQDAQDALLRATRIGDPGQIRDAQRAVQDAQRAIDEARLQQQATDERTAADKALQAQEDLLQRQYDAQVQAYQDQRAAARAAYDQARSDQWQHIQDELDDWRYMIDTKQKTYAQFLSWYARQSLGAAPSSFSSASGAASGGGSTSSGGGGAVGNAHRPGIQLQTGGYFRRPFPGIVASHEPEFVVPESWLSGDLRAELQEILARHRAPGSSWSGGHGAGTRVGGGLGGGGPLPGILVVNVGGSVVTEREISEIVRDNLVRLGRSSGGNVFGGQG